MMKQKKVVIFGGGTGTSYVLKGLKYFPVDITAVITVSDSGSSTGRLRKEFSTPAVGDIRKVLSNLSTLPDEIRDVMEYRLSIPGNDLDGHAMGNLVLTSLLKETGSLKTSIEYLSKLLDVKHKVLPLSEDYLTLMGETVDGEIIEGEDTITKVKEKYKKFFYKENPHVLPEIFAKIAEADLIILSMGSLFTSVLPHLLCSDVVQAINEAKSHAKIMYVCNAMTQPGETDDFGVSDHITFLENYLGKDTIDSVIVSTTELNEDILKKYETKEQKNLVKIDYDNLNKLKCKIIESDLLTTVDGTIKHNSLKLSSIIFFYLMNELD